jgi:outer membrane receptor protein involved in Fe transport
MKCSMRNAVLLRLLIVALSLAAALPASVSPAAAQGVTTGSLTGLVTDPNMQPVRAAQVIAIHLPSGTSYETVTRADGRFSIPGMRVGGPYSVTVAYSGSGGTAFAPQTKEDVNVNLGISTDLPFTVTAIAVQEEVTVTATVDPVFSSGRTGAATAVSRAEIATLPTLTGNISDVTRLTPQQSGTGAFGGQDDRLNNITVDGSYFNNAFGLGSGQPGGRTSVAPISLESIEQIQVNIAPFDVRQGNFVGASVNTVTRSGTNRLSASFYHRFRSEDFVGTEAAGNTVNPGTFTFRNTGVWAGGPIVRNRLFVFGNYENQRDVRPLSTFRANNGGEAVGGQVTRVLASDLNALSAFMASNFQYTTGGFNLIDNPTPAKRYLLRADYNLSNNNKINFRYNQLDSSSDSNLSGSSSAGFGRSTFSTNFLNFQASNYSQLEEIKSGVGEWNAVLGSTISNSLIVGYTSNNENRVTPHLFPFVDIRASDGNAYTALGTDPFTPHNELRYNTFQLQNNLTKFSARHSFTFGGTLQRYRSDNVFFPVGNSAYVYNSLDDFYADARGYVANPNRTVSPVTLARFQVRYPNIPGLDKPLQQLHVWYGGAYAQDEWRPRTNLTVTAGVRFDVPVFENTAFDNPAANALTFRDEDGQPVQYDSGKMPDARLLWSPRLGMNWDVAGRGTTQVRGGTGVFTGPPLYVWISNQIGNTGVLTGFEQIDNTTSRPFNPDPERYWPAVTGASATSYELNVTDSNFKFPQVWRNNVAVDQRLPWGLTATGEFLYNRDINGIYYINANLPAAQATFAGVDNRPRWTNNRLNAAPGNVVTSAIVLKNQSIGRSYNMSATLSRAAFAGISLRGAYSYGVSRNTIDPGSTALSSYNLNQHAGDPNNPGLGRADSTQGHRVYIQGSFTRSYFGFGSTTVAAFWEARPSTQNFASVGSYVFAQDMNNDGGAGNDLIYVPRNASEMNFVTFAAGGRTFTAAEQAAAFEAYISQDPHLRNRRGQYAERGGLTMPIFRKIDVNITQDIFRNIAGQRNGGQIRLDILNFGNLLNSNWGVSKRSVVAGTQANGIGILTTPGIDALGQANYRMAVVNGQLPTTTFQTNTNLADVYQFMVSFRYSFN